MAALNPGNPNGPPLLRQTLPAALRDVRLDYDHLVYIEDIPTSNGPPLESIELVWLTLPVPAFDGVWARADAPVAAGRRPAPGSGGRRRATRAMNRIAGRRPGSHQVLYYDKAAWK